VCQFLDFICVHLGHLRIDSSFLCAVFVFFVPLW
jgi:hypothetical protein